MDGSRFSIQKLNNSNYPSWRFKVELLLIREELWRYVEPGVKPAAVAADAWDAGDAKARATIGLLIDDNQHSLIRAVKTARDTWLALKNHHEKTSLTSKVSLLKRICDKRYSEGDSMEEHLFDMEELFSRLANAGQELEENLAVAMILRSLPSSFDALTTALESRDEADLTLELVKRKLLDEAAKRQGAATDSVLKVKEDCRRKKQVIVCHFCKQPGHKQRFCRQFIRESEKRTHPNPKPSKKKEDTVSFAFVTCATGSENINNKCWIVDSGASSHTVADRNFFVELCRSDVQYVKLADGKVAKVEGQGRGEIECCNEKGERRKMQLSAALYTPTLAMNLLSVSALTQKQATVVFNASGCKIKRGDETVAVASLRQGLYQLRLPNEVVSVAKSQHNVNCKHVWHRRFGHREPNAIKLLEKRNLVTGLELTDCGIDEPCECCMKGKSTRLPFPKESKTKTLAPLDIVHTDVCGPVEVPSVSGYRYFMTVIDDFSRHCTVYLLKEKSEVVEKIEEYVAYVKTHFGRKPKIVRSDQGGEYSSKRLRQYYKREGITPQFTAGYSPQQNGVAERRNRYLVEMVRCLLFEAGLPQCYWAEALSTAVYLQNILPSKSVTATPYELWFKAKPDVSHLRIFGSSAWVYIPKQKRKKLSETSRKLTFVGYSPEHKAYRFLDRSTRHVIVSRDAKFVEETPVTCNPDNTSANEESGTVEYEMQPGSPSRPDARPVAVPPIVEADSDHDIEESDDSFHGFSDEEPLRGEEVERASRRSERSTRGVPPERYGDVSGAVAQSSDEPRNYNEAMRSSDKSNWQVAMEEEIASLNEHRTWELVPLPPGKKAIGCRWTFKKKENETGQTVRYKARLVAQGFSQQFGSDFDEVFAPVVRQPTLRTMLTIASREGMLVKHLDIKTAYLYAELKEDIYMKQPPGFSEDNGLVCHLRRSIYGLKQSARIWNKKIDSFLQQMQFRASESDPCLYVRERNGKLSFILIYVDDIVVFCHSEGEFQEICGVLQKHFKLSSLGELRQFLGIHVEKIGDHYTLCQKNYIEKLVSRFGHDDAKTSKIPIDPAYVKQKEEEELPNNTSYCSLVGSLLYVAVNTRPDICVSTSLLGRKVTKPTNRDWTEAKRVLRYLKGTKDLRLHLGSGAGGLECFVDADWASVEGDRKSNSGFLIKYGGGLVNWGTRKQSCVALSSTEAEFIALAEGCQELLWHLKLSSDVNEKHLDPIPVWEDNQSCIKLVESDRIGKRSKHIDTKHAFTKDLKQREVIDLKYMPTSEMQADIMTKPLERVKLEGHRSAIGIRGDC